MTKAYLIVNFGGPRDQKEIRPFLQALLTDQDVVRTGWPQFLHNWFFSRIAKKRAIKIAHDYAQIGGGSPIFQDTENLASFLHKKLDATVLTFHRYLPETHRDFIRQMENLECQDIFVFTMFPQFSYATTGSIARWMKKHLSRKVIEKMRWRKSYPMQPNFVHATQSILKNFLVQQNVSLSDVLLLFSAHGLPQKFVETGDPYQKECEHSYNAVMKGFPGAASLLSYQSKFGKGEWLRPYTEDVAANILTYLQNKKCVVVVPISFTSDHIETLFEIEKLYLPVIRNAGIPAYRCPALGLDPLWIDAIEAILEENTWVDNEHLIRNKLGMECGGLTPLC